MLEIRHPIKPWVGYDRIYSEKGFYHSQSHFLWILRLLAPKAKGRLLDMSCGQGEFLKPAAQAGLQVFGLDISRVAIRLITAHDPSAKCVVGDGQRLPYRDEAFDYVVNLGSLEHYESPEKGVQELARVLKNDGLACILLPNSFGLLWNVFHVWRTGDIHDDGQPIQRYGTRNEWQRLLEGNGLVVAGIQGYNSRTFPRTWRDFWWYLRRPRKILTSLLFLPFIPLNGASIFAFLCRKK